MAAPGLRSPIALAWRLHRSLLIGWAAGLAVMGLALGGIASSLTSLLSDTPEMQQIIAWLGGNSGIIDAYFAFAMGLFAVIVAAYAIQATMRMRSEEVAERGEPVLATSVGRLRWVSSHLLFGFGGPAVVLAIMGLTSGLIAGMNTHNIGTQLPRVFSGRHGPTACRVGARRTDSSALWFGSPLDQLKLGRPGPVHLGAADRCSLESASVGVGPVTLYPYTQGARRDI